VDGADDVAVSRDDDAVDAAVLDAAVLDDAMLDDAVKEGRRSAGEKTAGPGPPEPELDGGGAMIEPPGTAGDERLEVADSAVADSSESEGSLFAEGLNQLVVAATACRTAWRPLSSTPLAADARPSE
jgi:hypothetical protein